MVSQRTSFVIAGSTGAATLTAASAPSPLYPVYQRLWGFSSFTLTLVFAVYVFALLAALLSVGSLSDRVGRRPVACAALVLLALGMVLFAIADGTGGLIAARIVQGFAVGTAAGTTTAMIMDAAPDSRYGSIVSSASPPTGIMIGAVLAGALVQFAPYPRQLVFWILAAVYLILAASVWLTSGAADPGSIPRESIWRTLLPSAGLPRDARPVFWSELPAIVATWALGGLYLSLGSSILATVLDVHSHFVVGIVLGSFFAAGAAGTIVSATVPVRARDWVGSGALVLGVLITLVAMVSLSTPLYIAGSVVAGLGFGALFKFAVRALGAAAPEATRGQVFATMYIASYIAFSVPALAAGLGVERFGIRPTAVTYAVAEVALVASAVLVRICRKDRSVAI